MFFYTTRIPIYNDKDTAYTTSFLILSGIEETSWVSTATFDLLLKYRCTLSDSFQTFLCDDNRKTVVVISVVVLDKIFFNTIQV